MESNLAGADGPGPSVAARRRLQNQLVESSAPSMRPQDCLRHRVASVGRPGGLGAARSRWAPPRSETAALRWGDVQDATDGRGVLVYIRRSKTDQDGTAADVRYLKNGCAVALRQLRDRRTVQRSGLRPEPTDQVLGGLNGQSIARRLTAAARAAGIEARITGHSRRVGLASELTARGASTTETMLAGGWKTARMVAHYPAGAAAEHGAVAKYL